GPHTGGALLQVDAEVALDHPLPVRGDGGHPVAAAHDAHVACRALVLVILHQAVFHIFVQRAGHAGPGAVGDVAVAAEDGLVAPQAVGDDAVAGDVLRVRQVQGVHPLAAVPAVGLHAGHGTV